MVRKEKGRTREEKDLRQQDERKDMRAMVRRAQKQRENGFCSEINRVMGSSQEADRRTMGRGRFMGIGVRNTGGVPSRRDKLIAAMTGTNIALNELVAGKASTWHFDLMAPTDAVKQKRRGG
ncbi:hypothetical protein MHYP_G00344210 [Metynnis hypsauchen]